MKTRPILIATTISLALVIVVTVVYVRTFGMNVGSDHAAWGQFGDFFAGVLNPLFAMLAFLALLWSIALQAAEFERVSGNFSEQLALARKGEEAARHARLTQELVAVIRDIDLRIDAVLGAQISEPGTQPRLTIRHMVSEANRLSRAHGSSAFYSRFSVLAREEGSIVEAHARDLIQLVQQMRVYLGDYEKVRDGAYAPIVSYYADKVYGILQLIEDLGGATSKDRAFFASVADRNR